MVLLFQCSGFGADYAQASAPRLAGSSSLERLAQRIAQLA
jgi:hypothetical protein